jgi:hypothetical protein
LAALYNSKTTIDEKENSTIGFYASLFSGCTALKPTAVTLNSPINDYQYVYITPTSEKNSVDGATIGGYYGIYGATSTHSVSPMDIISGHFIKKGFISETIAHLVEEVKRNSSRWIKTIDEGYEHFAWQGGYAAFSVSESVLPKTTAYINNQKQHHAKQNFHDEYLEFLKLYNIEYDERYVFTD